jgi:hypothetical protein
MRLVDQVKQTLEGAALNPVFHLETSFEGKGYTSGRGNGNAKTMCLGPK